MSSALLATGLPFSSIENCGDGADELNKSLSSRKPLTARRVPKDARRTTARLTARPADLRVAASDPSEDLVGLRMRDINVPDGRRGWRPETRGVVIVHLSPSCLLSGAAPLGEHTLSLMQYVSLSVGPLHCRLLPPSTPSPALSLSLSLSLYLYLLGRADLVSYACHGVLQPSRL